MGLGGNQRLEGEPFLLLRAMLGGVTWHIGVYVGHVGQPTPFLSSPSLFFIYISYIFLLFLAPFFIALTFLYSKVELTSSFFFLSDGL